ncbi:MAG: amidohydrolase, partial [Alphaproteobacteria bacterium]|nr:amidohydrolase [Alphaproteobacteria bacterium]
MNLKDMILVSVDDHIIEPATVFDNHMPKKFADRAPRLVYDREHNLQVWQWEGGVTATPFICAVVTLPPMEWGYDPTTLAEMRPGCWDVNQRVRDMDANGILASMNFASFPGAVGTFFAGAEDKDFAYTAVQAYNDWYIDEWCASHPGRFIPCPLPAIWDPELAAREVRRVARKGAKGISFSEAPETFGYPSIHTGEWDPFFKACVDEGV